MVIVCLPRVIHVGVYNYICTLLIPLGFILILYVHILKNARHQAWRIAAQNYLGNHPDGQNALQPISTVCNNCTHHNGSPVLTWIPVVIVLALLDAEYFSPNVNSASLLTLFTSVTAG